MAITREDTTRTPISWPVLLLLLVGHLVLGEFVCMAVVV